MNKPLKIPTKENLLEFKSLNSFVPKKIKNILLIHVGKKSSEQYLVSPPLGLMYISSYVKKYIPGIHIHIHDMKPNNDTPEILGKLLKNLRPDVIGLSVISPQANYLPEVVHALKIFCPGIPLILGGAHISSIRGKIFREVPIDYGIIGEGEKTFCELIKILEKKHLRYGELKNINGLMFMLGDNVVINDKFKYFEKLDELPFPDWDAIDIGEYTKNYSFSEMKNSRYMPLFTSRGCPFKCNYCHDSLGKAFRFRSPKNVVDEIEILVKKYKVNRFEVFDDIFNFKKDRVLEICREIKSRNLKIKLAFPNAVRGDILDEEVIDALKMAGTDYLYFAIETATPSLQKKIKKHINLKRIKKNINYAVKKRIYCGGFFMLGFPGETREQIMDTINFALDLKIHQAAFFSVTPYEGTELFNSLNNEPGKQKIEFSEYNPRLGSANCSNLNIEELNLYCKYAYRKFYLNPIRMFRILRDYPRGYKVLLNQFNLLLKTISHNIIKENKKVTSH